MAIIRPENMDFSAKNFNIVLSGTPGMWKTTTALSAPKTLLFDFDRGVARVSAEHRGLTVSNDTYEDFLNDLESPEFRDCETVILDTIGSYVELAKPWARKRDKRAASDGRAMFGVIKSEYIRLSEWLNAQRKNVVSLFHTTEKEKDGETIIRLYAEGSVKDIVWTPADIGGHMFVMGDRHFIGFSPTKEYYAKSNFGIIGVREIPRLTPGDPNRFLTDLIAEMRAYIIRDQQALAPQRAAYDAAIARGRAPIAAAEDVDGLNAALSEIMNIEHALTSKKELGSELNARAREIGCKFDRKAGAYVVQNNA
jgi:hypothetical protein